MKERHLTARNNPLLQRIRRVVKDPGASRQLATTWWEGEHLVQALMQRRPEGVRGLVVSAAHRDHAPWQPWFAAAPEVVTVPDGLMRELTAMDSPPRIAAWCAGPPADSLLQAGRPTLVLDRVQDAGNVGSLMRTAAAMGFEQLVALKGTAQLWAPKVLRAAMGAHLSLHGVEGVSPQELSALGLPLLGTALSEGAEVLQTADLPWPCAWVVGHEGQGVSTALLAQCQRVFRIAQPGGEESLNVGAAAAMCLYESARQALRAVPAPLQ